MAGVANLQNVVVDALFTNADQSLLTADAAFTPFLELFSAF